MFSDGLLISEAKSEAPPCASWRRWSRSFSALLGWGAESAGEEEEALEYGWVSGVHRIAASAASSDPSSDHHHGAPLSVDGQKILIRLEGDVWWLVQADAHARDAWTSDLVATAIRLAMQPPAQGSARSSSSKNLRWPGKIGQNGTVRGHMCMRWLGGAMLLSLLVLLVAVGMEVSPVMARRPLLRAFFAAGEVGAGPQVQRRTDKALGKRGKAAPAATRDGVDASQDKRRRPRGARGDGMDRAMDKEGSGRGASAGRERSIQSGGVLARLEDECRSLSAEQRAKGLDGCMHAAAASGKLELLRQLLEEGGRGVLERDVVSGQTVLHAAAAAGQTSTLEMLMKRGGRALALAVDAEGETCLHAAARSNAVQVVDLLAANGPWALKKQRSSNGDTCLHTAVRALASGAVAALVASGGREFLQARNEDGQTALDLTEHLAQLAADADLRSAPGGGTSASRRVLTEMSKMLRKRLKVKGPASKEKQPLKE